MARNTSCLVNIRISTALRYEIISCLRGLIRVWTDLNAGVEVEAWLLHDLVHHEWKQTFSWECQHCVMMINNVLYIIIIAPRGGLNIR